MAIGHSWTSSLLLIIIIRAWIIISALKANSTLLRLIKFLIMWVVPQVPVKNSHFNALVVRLTS